MFLSQITEDRRDFRHDGGQKVLGDVQYNARVLLESLLNDQKRALADQHGIFMGFIYISSIMIWMKG